MSDTLEQHVSQLRSSAPQQRAIAAQALCQYGQTASPAALALVEALADESAEVADWAYAALEDVGPPQTGQVASLARLVNDTHEGVSYWAATLLGRLGPQAAPAREALEQAVQQHPSLSTRQRAAWSLGQIGPGAHEAIPALQAATRETNTRLARLAQQAVELIQHSD